MPPLPRLECPVCLRLVPVRRNGALREHPWAPNQTKCSGSGYTPVEVIKEKPWLQR